MRVRSVVAACVLALAVGCSNKQEQANRLFELGISYVGQQNFTAAAQVLERAVQLAPNHVAAHRNLGDVYYFLGRYDEAVKEIETTVQLDPSYAEQGYIKAAAARERQGRVPDAIASYERAAQISPGLAGLRLALGQLYSRAGNLPRAQQQFIRAITLAPTDSRGHNGLGIVYAMAGRHYEALEAFGRAATMDPKNAMAHHNLGLEYAALKWFPEAEKSFREALALLPTYLESHIQLSRVLADQARFEEAIAGYERVLKDRPRDAYFVAKIGDILLKQGKMDEAIERLKLALQHNPQDNYRDGTSAHYLLGTAYAKLNKEAEAMAEYEQAVKLSPSCMEAKKALAALYVKEGKTKEAEDLKKAVDEFESKAGPLNKGLEAYLAGLAALRKKQYVAAEAKLREAMQVIPEFLAVRTDLGRVLYAQGKLEEAKVQFEAVTEKDKEAGDALYHLSLIAAKSGRAAEALDLLRSAANAAPYNAAFHMELGQMLLAGGKTDEATSAFADAARMKPDWKEAYEALANAYEKAGKPEDAQRQRETLKKLSEPPTEPKTPPGAPPPTQASTASPEPAPNKALRSPLPPPAKTSKP